MKQTALLFAASLLILACKKDDTSPFGEIWKGPQEYGYAKATRNGEVWEASAIAIRRDDKPKYCGLNFSAYFQTDSIWAESFDFDMVPIKTGTYNVHHTIGLGESWADSLSSLYALVYYDVPRATYYPHSVALSLLGKNQLVIEEVDAVEGTISGRFNMTFRIKDQDKDDGYPNLVHFSDGVFKTKFR